MEQIIKTGNKTEHYLNGELLLSITDLGNNYYIVENKFRRLEGYCRVLDNYRTNVNLTKNYTIGKNNRLYNSKKLIDHNAGWFAYILAEEGIIQKTIPVG